MTWTARSRASKAWPRDERPNAPIVFWTFRIMVGIGLLMIALGLWSLLAALARPALRQRRWLHRAAVLMGPAGFVAVLAGWITTEVGRQPYTVYGLLRTAESRLADRRRRPSAPRWSPSSSSISSSSAPASSTSCA